MTDIPALGFKFQAVYDKDARRSVVFETFLARDTSQNDLDAMLDKLRIATDRQIAFSELEEALRFKEDHARTLHALNAQMASIMELERLRWADSGRFGEWSEESMSVKEQEALKNIQVSIRKYKEGYERYARDEERARARLNGHANGSDLGTDHLSGVPNS